MKDRTIEQDILDLLSSKGIVTSLAFGPMKGFSCPMWSVTCMNAYGDEFHKPQAANDFLNACMIAKIECADRGWLNQET